MKGFVAGVMASLLIGCATGMSHTDVQYLNQVLAEYKGGIQVLGNAVIEMSERIAVLERRLGVKKKAEQAK